MEKRISFAWWTVIFAALTLLSTFLMGLLPGVAVVVSYVFAAKMYGKSWVDALRFDLFNVIALAAALVIRCAGLKAATFCGLI